MFRYCCSLQRIQVKQYRDRKLRRDLDISELLEEREVGDVAANEVTSFRDNRTPASLLKRANETVAFSLYNKDMYR